jgi:signal transduction histidine kinase
MNPKGRPTASFFVQLLTLTVLTLFASWAISFYLVFKLPPPAPDFYRLPEIERTFRGTPPTFSERHPLVLHRAASAPEPELQGRTIPLLRKKLARDLGVPVANVVVAGERGPLADRRVGRVIRERATRANMTEEHFLIEPFKVGVKEPDGRWLVVSPDPGVGLSDWQQRVVLWFVLALAAMTPFIWIFARRLAAPIKVFADAAERLGRDPTAPPLALKGPSEIGVAARAFNGMQERLRRYVEDRTAMVGAIAHDLRTPLTRLRFRIENLPDDQAEQKAKIESDLDQMEQMIAATLAFVRDASRPGERTPLELSSLLESLCDEMAETGAKTELVEGEKVVLEGDPMALRRLFSNLLENAVKFGGRARARIAREGGNAVVEIDDDGPGIPPADAEKVFEPFYRREPSRNRQTGGIGLGLAVVRSIARGHGGDVSLVNRDGGGLTARVLLPL